MGSSSAIGDALIGRRKWTDPQVVEERDILLGSDWAKARDYVSMVRNKMLARYAETFRQLEEVERKAFGDHSYFYCLDHGTEASVSSESSGSNEEEWDGGGGQGMDED
jgi:hypothetical protein